MDYCLNLAGNLVKICLRSWQDQTVVRVSRTKGPKSRCHIRLCGSSGRQGLSLATSSNIHRAATHQFRQALDRWRILESASAGPGSLRDRSKIGGGRAPRIAPASLGPTAPQPRPAFEHIHARVSPPGCRRSQAKQAPQPEIGFFPHIQLRKISNVDR